MIIWNIFWVSRLLVCRAEKLEAFTCRYYRDNGALNSWKPKGLFRPLSKLSLNRLEKRLQSGLVLER
jgi:hypothetical protein